MRFTATPDGLLRDGEPFVALGVNYHPSGAGCGIWREWDAGALDADFRRIAASGLNTVRLFLFWRDFQPCRERLDPAVFQRLDEALDAAERAGLACVLSVFTLWMNGQVLDLPWREGRDLWRDETMLRASLEYAGEVARTAAGRDCVLAYDLGDELWNIDPGLARSLSPRQVARWQSRVAAAIREKDQGALVLQANDASAFFGGAAYGVDNVEGLDVAGIHGFPTWSPGSFESTLCYKSSHLAAFLSRAARAYRPAIVDELAAYGVDEATAAAHVGASAVAALCHGAGGVIAWSWQDVAATSEPYAERPMERHTGLHRLDGTPKPVMDRLRQVIAARESFTGSADRADTALYLPEHVRESGGSYLEGGGSALATFYCYLLLTRAHLPFDITASDLPGRRLILCPCPTRLTLADLTRLETAARAGATVYLSLGDHLHAFPGPELTGAHLVDFDLPGAASGKEALRWHGQEWAIDWSIAGGIPVTIQATSATVLARFPDGSPALLENAVGRGRFLFAAAPFERQLDQPGRLAAAEWESFYTRLAERCGVRPPVECDSPDVEVVAGSAGGRPTVLINHSDRAVKASVGEAGGRTVGVEIEAKGWRVIESTERSSAWT